VRCLHGFDWESHGGAHRVSPEAASKIKAQAEAKFHMYCFYFCADDLMKLLSFVRVVIMWCSVCTDPILRCFDNREGLNCGYFLVGVVPEPLSWLMV
jgi:hypothetical protein